MTSTLSSVEVPAQPADTDAGLKAQILTRGIGLAAGMPLAAYGPSPGYTNLLWPKPVFVGDTLQYRSRVIGKVAMPSHPDRGVLLQEAQGRNQNGDIVLALTMQTLVERRPVHGE